MGSSVVELPIMTGARKGDVLNMPCGPRSTFGDVRMFLQNEVGDREIAVFLDEHGSRTLSHESFASKTLRESGRFSSRIPVFIHEPGDCFLVFVQTLTGKAIAIVAYKTYSTEDLKLRVFAREGIPVDQQRLIFAGKQLDDSRKLREYGIGPNSSLHLLLRLRGGGFRPQSLMLVDVSKDEARVDHAWSSNAPKWRTAATGFTIEGPCANTECEAFNDPVICNMGFGCFNMKTFVPNCPVCHCMIDCENIGFNNCFYRIRGVKAENDVPVSMLWTRVGDCYRTWDEGRAGVVEWEYMEIIVRELRTAKKVPGTRCKKAPVAEQCAICFDRLADQQDAVMLRCCHSYHDNCWKGWSDVLQSKGCEITCPLCRTVALEI